MDEIAKLILAQNKLLAEIAGTLTEIAGEGRVYCEYTTDSSGRVYRQSKQTSGGRIIPGDTEEL